MPGKSKVKAKKSQGKKGNQERRNTPTSPISRQKHKFLAELHGIEMLEIQTPAIDEPLSTRSSLKELSIKRESTIV